MTAERDNSPAVAVVLVNWNNWRDTIQCLDSLLAMTYGSFHIVVVDNDSQDGSVDHVVDWCRRPVLDPQWRPKEGVGGISHQSSAPVSHRVVIAPVDAGSVEIDAARVTILRAGGNLGFAGGCNAGIRAAGLHSFDYFWLLNTDTVVACDALTALVRRAQREPRPGMVGSTIRFYDAPEVVQALGGAHVENSGVSWRLIGQGVSLDECRGDPASIESQMEYVMGASMLVSAEFVREIGPMQEDYFLYYEEIDWAMRGKGRFRLGYAPDSHVFHKSGRSSSSVMEEFSSSLYYRNRIRFVSRFFPERVRAVRRSLVWEALRFGMKRDWGRARLVLGIWRNARQIEVEAGRISR